MGFSCNARSIECMEDSRSEIARNVRVIAPGGEIFIEPVLTNEYVVHSKMIDHAARRIGRTVFAVSPPHLHRHETREAIAVNITNMTNIAWMKIILSLARFSRPASQGPGGPPRIERQASADLSINLWQ